MGLRREGLNIIFGAVLMALGFQFGLIKPELGFFHNVLASAVLMILARVFALLFGGRGK